MLLLPSYIPAKSGELTVFYENRLWELTTWISGTPAAGGTCADLADVGEIQAMFAALVQFHQFGESPGDTSGQPGPSPGIEARQGVLARWQGDSEEELFARSAADYRHLRPLAAEIWGGFRRYEGRLASALTWGAGLSLPLVTCVGDPRPEHFLFSDGRLQGMVDFGSLRQDAAALDFARLAGELYQNDAARWETAWEWFGPPLGLDLSQYRLAWVFDAANVLLGGMNWIGWLWGENRRFDDMQEVETRLRHLVARIENLGDHPGFSVGNRDMGA